MSLQSAWNAERLHKLNNYEITAGPVIYWMSRDQRVHDNWALLYAQGQAQKREQSLVVVFTLTPKFMEATLRQYDFMLQGLRETAKELSSYGINFELLLDKDPAHALAKYAQDKQAGLIVSDFSPLRLGRQWRKDLASNVEIALHEIDTHNIVPVWVTSQKQEYAAHTIRKKIMDKLDIWLNELPELQMQKNSLPTEEIAWDDLQQKLTLDKSVKPIDWIVSGATAAKASLRDFTENHLEGYAKKRNNPNEDQQSGLSPYLHFGQLSAQRVALEVSKAAVPQEDKDAFLEQLIVRRELSDNFCFYNSDYDNHNCYPEWAKQSHAEHEDDKREYVYTKEQFENAETHDELWNAAQLQMVKTGKMHGYLRMYWAKKILEWTNTVAFAHRVAVELNDRYELDGRDPNGYVGIAWCLGGVHDRPWFRRDVYGLIRYMSRSGMEKKFDVEAYVKLYLTEK